MTMLTPTRGPFERARYGWKAEATFAGSAAHLATIKRSLSASLPC